MATLKLTSYIKRDIVTAVEASFAPRLDIPKQKLQEAVKAEHGTVREAVIKYVSTWGGMTREVYDCVVGQGKWGVPHVHFAIQSVAGTTLNPEMWREMFTSPIFGGAMDGPYGARNVHLSGSPALGAIAAEAVATWESIAAEREEAKNHIKSVLEQAKSVNDLLKKVPALRPFIPRNYLEVVDRARPPRQPKLRPGDVTAPPIAPGATALDSLAGVLTTNTLVAVAQGKV